MSKALVIGELKAPIPVIQGGMGVGVSLSKLAGNVAKCGGIGIISKRSPKAESWGSTSWWQPGDMKIM